MADGVSLAMPICSVSQQSYSQPPHGVHIMRTDRVFQIRSKQLSACDRSLLSPCLQDLQRPYTSLLNGVSVDAKIPGFADIVKIDIGIANSSSVLLFLPVLRGGCRYVHLYAAGKGAINR